MSLPEGSLPPKRCRVCKEKLSFAKQRQNPTGTCSVFCSQRYRQLERLGLLHVLDREEPERGWWEPGDADE